MLNWQDKKITKIISIILISTFLVTGVVYPEPSDRSFFKGKRPDYKKIQEQRESALREKKEVLSGKKEAQKPSYKQSPTHSISLSSIKDLSSIYIPDTLGKVVEAYQDQNFGLAGQKPLIIHIQDLHTNPEGQFNEAAILETLIKDYKLDLVCSEGAEGEVDTSSVSSFPDADVREKTARLFVNSGELTAEEYLSITKYPDLAIWGVEDKDIYFKNIIEFNKIMKFSQDAGIFISQVKDALSQLKPRVYSKELLEIDVKQKDYEETKIETNEYLDYLIKIVTDNSVLNKYKNITLLEEAIQAEKSIGQEKVMQESQSLIQALESVLSQADKKELDILFGKASLFKDQKITAFSFYSYLKGLSDKYLKGDLENYQNLIQFTDYLEKTNSLNSIKLFNEIEELTYEIKDLVSENENQKLLTKALRNIKLVENFFNLKISNEELQYYFANKEEHKVGFFETFLKQTLKKYNIDAFIDYNPKLIDAHLPELEHFYEIAKKRDIAMIDNAIKEIKKRNAKVIALIAGGFHTPGFTRLLKEKGYPYVVITPYSSTEIDEENYHFLLSGKRKPITKLVEGLNEQLRVPMAFGNGNGLRIKDTIDAKLASGHGVKADFFIAQWSIARSAVNEDTVYADSKYQSIALGDGLDGYPAGEDASRLAVEVFSDAIKGLSSARSIEEAKDIVYNKAIPLANTRILEHAASNSEKKDMGSAFAAAPVWIDDAGIPWLIAANIGDARIYIRKATGEMMQVSKDDTRESDNPRIIGKFITAFLGREDFKLKEHQKICMQLEPGDIVALMSDGFYEVLEEEQKFREVVKQCDTPESLVDGLKDVFNSNEFISTIGTADDASIVAIRVPALASNQSVQEILNLAISEETDSVGINSTLYNRLKTQVRLKLISALDGAVKKDRKLLHPNWIIGNYSFAPIKEGEILARFLGELGYIAKVRQSDYAPGTFARSGFTIIAGEKIYNKPMKGGKVLGDGGMSVWNNKRRFAVISDAVPIEEWAQFRSDMSGILRVYTLPKPSDTPFSFHIDDRLCFIDALNIILINPYYYKENKKLIDKIAIEEGYVDKKGIPKIAFVDVDEIDLLPANADILEDGRVLMNYAPKTLENIAKALNLRPLDITSTIIMSGKISFKYCTQQLNGGLLCMSNKNYPLMEYLKDEGWSREEIASIIMVKDYQRDLWNVGEDNKIMLNENAVDMAVNELLLRWVLRHASGNKDVLEKRLKDISDNFSALGYVSAAEKIGIISAGGNILASNQSLVPEYTYAPKTKSAQTKLRTKTDNLNKKYGVWDEKTAFKKMGELQDELLGIFKDIDPDTSIGKRDIMRLVTFNECLGIFIEIMDRLGTESERKKTLSSLSLYFNPAKAIMLRKEYAKWQIQYERMQKGKTTLFDKIPRIKALYLLLYLSKWDERKTGGLFVDLLQSSLKKDRNKVLAVAEQFKNLETQRLELVQWDLLNRFPGKEGLVLFHGAQNENEAEIFHDKAGYLLTATFFSDVPGYAEDFAYEEEGGAVIAANIPFEKILYTTWLYTKARLEEPEISVVPGQISDFGDIGIFYLDAEEDMASYRDFKAEYISSRKTYYAKAHIEDIHARLYSMLETVQDRKKDRLASNQAVVTEIFEGRSENDRPGARFPLSKGWIREIQLASNQELNSIALAQKTISKIDSLSFAERGAEIENLRTNLLKGAVKFASNPVLFAKWLAKNLPKIENIDKYQLYMVLMNYAGFIHYHVEHGKGWRVATEAARLKPGKKEEGLIMKRYAEIFMQILREIKGSPVHRLREAARALESEQELAEELQKEFPWHYDLIRHLVGYINQLTENDSEIGGDITMLGNPLRFTEYLDELYLLSGLKDSDIESLIKAVKDSITAETRFILTEKVPKIRPRIVKQMNLDAESKSRKDKIRWLIKDIEEDENRPSEDKKYAGYDGIMLVGSLQEMGDILSNYEYAGMHFDRRHGNDEDLRHLVKVARKKGIEIIVDVVLGHTGEDVSGRPFPAGCYSNKPGRWGNKLDYSKDETVMLATWFLRRLRNLGVRWIRCDQPGELGDRGGEVWENSHGLGLGTIGEWENFQDVPQVDFVYSKWKKTASGIYEELRDFGNNAEGRTSFETLRFLLGARVRSLPGHQFSWVIFDDHDEQQFAPIITFIGKDSKGEWNLDKLKAYYLAVFTAWLSLPEGDRERISIMEHSGTAEGNIKPLFHTYAFQEYMDLRKEGEKVFPGFAGFSADVRSFVKEVIDKNGRVVELPSDDPYRRTLQIEMDDQVHQIVIDLKDEDGWKRSGIKRNLRTHAFSLDEKDRIKEAMPLLGDEILKAIDFLKDRGVLENIHNLTVIEGSNQTFAELKEDRIILRLGDTSFLKGKFKNEKFLYFVYMLARIKGTFGKPKEAEARTSATSSDIILTKDGIEILIYEDYETGEVFMLAANFKEGGGQEKTWSHPQLKSQFFKGGNFIVNSTIIKNGITIDAKTRIYRIPVNRQFGIGLPPGSCEIFRFIPKGVAFGTDTMQKFFGISPELNSVLSFFVTAGVFDKGRIISRIIVLKDSQEGISAEFIGEEVKEFVIHIPQDREPSLEEYVSVIASSFRKLDLKFLLTEAQNKNIEFSKNLEDAVLKVYEKNKPILDAIRRVWDRKRDIFENMRKDRPLDKYIKKWASKFTSLLQRFIFVSWQMEMGFHPEISLELLKVMEKKVSDGKLSIEESDRLMKMIAMAEMTGGLGALMVCLLRALSDNGLDVLSLNVLYDEYFDEMTGDAVKIKDLFLEALRQLGAETIKDIEVELADGGKTTVTAYICKLGTATQVWIEHADFDRVYRGKPDSAERAKQIKLYNDAGQAIVKRLIEEKKIDKEIVLLEHEIYAYLPKDKINPKYTFIFNHTVVSDALAKFAKYLFEKLNLDRQFGEIIYGKDSELRLVIIGARRALRIFGVAKIHAKILYKKVFPEVLNEAGADEQLKKEILEKIVTDENGYENVPQNGTHAKHFQAPEIQVLIGEYLEKYISEEVLKGRDRDMVLEELSDKNNAPFIEYLKRDKAAFNQELDAKKQGLQRYWIDLLKSQGIEWEADENSPPGSIIRRVVPYKELIKFIQILQDGELRKRFVESGRRVVPGGRIFDEKGRETLSSIPGIVKQHGLEKLVAVLDDYNITDAGIIFQGAGFVIMLSDEGKEAASTSGTKALSNGTPVIVVADGVFSNLDGYVEEFDFDKLTGNGFIVRYKNGEPDPESLVECLEKMKKVYSDPKYRQAIQFNALIKWLEKGDITMHQARDISKVMNEAVEGKEKLASNQSLTELNALLKEQEGLKERLENLTALGLTENDRDVVDLRIQIAAVEGRIKRLRQEIGKGTADLKGLSDGSYINVEKLPESPPKSILLFLRREGFNNVILWGDSVRGLRRGKYSKDLDCVIKIPLNEEQKRELIQGSTNFTEHVVREKKKVVDSLLSKLNAVNVTGLTFEGVPVNFLNTVYVDENDEIINLGTDLSINFIGIAPDGRIYSAYEGSESLDDKIGSLKIRKKDSFDFRNILRSLRFKYEIGLKFDDKTEEIIRSSVRDFGYMDSVPKVHTDGMKDILYYAESFDDAYEGLISYGLISLFQDHGVPTDIIIDEMRLVRVLKDTASKLESNKDDIQAISRSIQEEIIRLGKDRNITWNGSWQGMSIDGEKTLHFYSIKAGNRDYIFGYRDGIDAGEGKGLFSWYKFKNRINQMDYERTEPPTMLASNQLLPEVDLAFEMLQEKGSLVNKEFRGRYPEINPQKAAFILKKMQKLHPDEVTGERLMIHTGRLSDYDFYIYLSPAESLKRQTERRNRIREDVRRFIVARVSNMAEDYLELKDAILNDHPQAGEKIESFLQYRDGLQEIKYYIDNIETNIKYGTERDRRYWFDSYGNGILRAIGYYLFNRLTALSNTGDLKKQDMDRIIARIGFDIHRLLIYSGLPSDKRLLDGVKVEDVGYEAVETDSALPLEEYVLPGQNPELELERLGWNGRVISATADEPVYSTLDDIIGEIREGNEWQMLIQDNGTLVSVRQENYKELQDPILKKALSAEEGLERFRDEVMAKMEEHRINKIKAPILCTIDGRRGVGKSFLTAVIREEGAFGLNKEEIMVIEREDIATLASIFLQEFMDKHPQVKLIVVEGIYSTFLGYFLKEADVAVLVIADRATRRKNLIERSGLWGFALEAELDLDVSSWGDEGKKLLPEWVDIVIDNSESRRIPKERIKSKLASNAEIDRLKVEEFAAIAQGLEDFYEGRIMPIFREINPKAKNVIDDHIMRSLITVIKIYVNDAQRRLKNGEMDALLKLLDVSLGIIGRYEEIFKLWSSELGILTYAEQLSVSGDEDKEALAGEINDNAAFRNAFVNVMEEYVLYVEAQHRKLDEIIAYFEKRKDNSAAALASNHLLPEALLKSRITEGRYFNKDSEWIAKVFREVAYLFYEDAHSKEEEQKRMQKVGYALMGPFDRNIDSLASWIEIKGPDRIIKAVNDGNLEILEPKERQCARALLAMKELKSYLLGLAGDDIFAPEDFEEKLNHALHYIYAEGIGEKWRKALSETGIYELSTSQAESAMLASNGRLTGVFNSLQTARSIYTNL